MGKQYGTSYKKVTVEDVRRWLMHGWLSFSLSLFVTLTTLCFIQGVFMVIVRGWDEAGVSRVGMVEVSGSLVGDDRSVILM